MLAYQFEYLDMKVHFPDDLDIKKRGNEIRGILYYLIGSSVLNILVLIFLFKSRVSSKHEVVSC